MRLSTYNHGQEKIEINYFSAQDTAKTQKGLSAVLHCNLTMLETISPVQKHSWEEDI